MSHETWLLMLNYSKILRDTELLFWTIRLTRNQKHWKIASNSHVARGQMWSVRHLWRSVNSGESWREPQSLTQVTQPWECTAATVESKHKESSRHNMSGRRRVNIGIIGRYCRCRANVRSILATLLSSGALCQTSGWCQPDGNTPCKIERYSYDRSLYRHWSVGGQIY